MLDAIGLDAVVIDLTDAPGRVQRGSFDVIDDAGKRIAQVAASFVNDLDHAPLYPRSITSETTIQRGGFEAEIGPDKNLPQGALGNLIEYGSVNNGPNAHLGPAIDIEAPGVDEELADLGAPW